jgi:hypothetical protein
MGNAPNSPRAAPARPRSGGPAFNKFGPCFFKKPPPLIPSLSWQTIGFHEETAQHEVFAGNDCPQSLTVALRVASVAHPGGAERRRDDIEREGPGHEGVGVAAGERADHEQAQLPR